VERLSEARELELDSLSLAEMATSTKPRYRVLAVLKLPRNNVPPQITYASRIVTSMTDNAWFPSPVPPLATVSAAIDALAEAQTATLSKTVGTADTRDDRRRDMIQRLELLKAYVQGIADANPDSAVSIIESAGMAVKGRRGPGGRVFGAKRGLVSGSMSLTASKAGERASYEWAYSLDGAVTWILLPGTNSASTTVTGLKPGAKLLFRYRVCVKDVWSDWSDPIAVIVD
jgi:hypothetical protein